MKITKTYFMVMAADVARGANFYRKAFGLTTGLGFYVDDLEAACDAVKAAGGKIAKEPEDRTGEGIRLATAVDSEGNRFSLAQPVGQASSR